MIYVTGDIHADPSRFSNQNFPEQSGMTKDDYIVILGDFGLVFDTPEESKSEKYWLQWLEERPFTTLFVDGNHENFDRLNAFPVEEWHGGKVQKIRPSVIHLMRGEIYEINDVSVFAFGGAPSADIRGLATKEELQKNYAAGILDPQASDYEEKLAKLKKINKMFFVKPYRILGKSWWPQEIASEEEMEYGLQNLAAHGNKVDFIFTHEGPSSAVAAGWLGAYKANVQSKYLEKVRQQTQYSAWLFGHYHENRRITEKELCFYTQITRVW